jgi:hypothetical protein
MADPSATTVSQQDLEATRQFVAGVAITETASPYDVVTARVPSQNVEEAAVGVSLSAVNSAFAPLAFDYDASDQSVTQKDFFSAEQLRDVVDALFDHSTMLETERVRLADAIGKVLCAQIAKDVPLEFSSGDEVKSRIALTRSTLLGGIEAAPRSGGTATTSHLLKGLISSILDSTGIPDGDDPTEVAAYSEYSTSLLRNLILTVCEREAATRVAAVDSEDATAGSKIVFKHSDEIVFYLGYQGSVRVGAAAADAENFGLTRAALAQDASVERLDENHWLKLRIQLR